MRQHEHVTTAAVNYDRLAVWTQSLKFAPIDQMVAQ